MRRALVALLVVPGIAALSLLPACGGGGSEPQSEGENGSRFSDVVTANLATELGLDGLVWENESSSDWRDAQLFANRILGETDAPLLDEMEITVLDDETSGEGRTVVVRVLVADLTADYRISMQDVGGQWKVTSYEVEEIVEAMGR